MKIEMTYEEILATLQRIMEPREGNPDAEPIPDENYYDWEDPN